MTHILAVDQGTTSTRAILFEVGTGGALRPRAQAAQEFTQSFPASGWVEHDALEIWETAVATLRAALAQGGVAAGAVAALGITNQRETVVLWERASGRPLGPALVWQDRRTADTCAALRAGGVEEEVRARTGLLLDPYFSATKLGWMLDHIPGARGEAEAGRLAFGTIDSWLIWKLTGGRVHATDATNAARTMLYDIHAGEWSEDLCRLFRVPMGILPEVRDCADDYGTTDPSLFGAAIPIRGVAGDQQAATVGQACFVPGMMKSTYGTGCFALLNTGATPVASQHRLLTTIAYRLRGQVSYALEGSIFVAGAVVQWLRDGLGVIARAEECDALARAADPASGVVIVPAFTGLGAPWWAPGARGAVFGLSRGAGREELVRAALESVGHQTRDLWEAMRADWPGVAGQGAVLRVDGGMSASDWTMQYLADILGAPVDRPEVLETTALGAAWLAGFGVDLCPGPAEFAAEWACARRFNPAMAAPERNERHARWKAAVSATLAFS